MVVRSGFFVFFFNALRGVLGHQSQPVDEQRPARDLELDLTERVEPDRYDELCIPIRHRFGADVFGPDLHASLLAACA